MNLIKQIAFILLAIFFISCESSNPESYTRINYYETIPIFDLNPPVSWTYYTGRIYLSHNITYDSIGNRKTNNSIVGLLYSESRSYFDGGILLVDSLQIPLVNVEKIYGYKSYNADIFSFGKGYFLDSASFPLGNHSYKFNLSGVSYFTGFSAEVPALKDIPKITSHTNQSKIISTDSLMVTWESTDSNLNYRLLVSNGNKRYVVYGANKSSAVIPIEYMNYLGKGTVKMELVLGKYVTLMADSKNYNVCAVYTSETLDLISE